MARKKKEVKLYTLDTETIGLGGNIRRIAVYDGNKVLYGYSFSDIEPFLINDSKKYKVHIYVHNLDFDLRKCPELFREGNVKWGKTLVINRRYSTLTCEHYTLHDSFQLLPMSLAKASKSFNLEHGKLDLWDEVQKVYPGEYKDVVDFLARCHIDDELYLKYLGYDVIALYELIEKLIQVSTIPLSALVKCPSTASMSKYIIKNGYNGQVFYTEGFKKSDYEKLIQNKYWLSDKPMKDNPEVTWQEVEYKIREAYYGGRTEVFTPLLEELPNKQIAGYHYDVNSLYPSVCLNNEYPIGVPKFYKASNVISFRWRTWLNSHIGLGFIKAKVFVPKQKIPPLPSRLEKLCFLCGYLEGTWTFHELEYAVQHCGVKIIEFQEMIYFKETFKVYDNYIKVFSDMKEQATKDKNNALREFCKLMMNTAYGWTAMKRLQISLDNIEKAEKYKDNGTLIFEDKELGNCQYSTLARSETIQVQVGAYVTSYARLVLLKALRKQAEKGEVYYCDTDSIVCEKPLDEDMIDNVQIGKWGLENVLLKGLFLQPKVYTEVTLEDTNFKFKGVTKERQKTFDYSFYEDLYSALCKKQKGKFEIEKNIERLRSLITAQKNNHNPNEVILTHKALNLENIQKRNIDYKNNYSVAWFMYDFDYFYNFTFQEDYIKEGEFFEKRRKQTTY